MVQMSSFAAGKGSALVIDIGQSTASVTPVVDGFVLRKGAYSSQGRIQIINPEFDRSRSLRTSTSCSSTSTAHPHESYGASSGHSATFPPINRKPYCAYFSIHSPDTMMRYQSIRTAGRSWPDAYIFYPRGPPLSDYPKPHVLL